jgi:diadenosine tetraphosphate (Ap4A) HIT family hydrolase
MDLHPINPGHILVVPNLHASNLGEVDHHVWGHMFVVGRKLALALRRSELRSDGINLFVADGAVAGQTVFHSHLHVVPRHAGDGLRFHLPEEYHRRTSRADLDDVAAKVRDALDENTGDTSPR